MEICQIESEVKSLAKVRECRAKVQIFLSVEVGGECLQKIKLSKEDLSYVTKRMLRAVASLN